MSFPRYPRYKDSGVEWLGQVPEHWSVEPFKRQIERNDGGVWGEDPDGIDDTVVLRSTEQTVDGHWQLDDPARRKLSEAEINGSLLIEGDLLLTKSSGSSLHIGKTTLVTPEVAAMRCCYSNFMQRIRTKASFFPKLAWHFLNNDLARLQFDLFSNSTTGLANLNGTMIGQITVPVPPLAEQTAIAAFLDRETGKIDELVAEQRRLMELLKEKRQAVISHAVTRGLNPAAPLKPSGIEWLGDVPAHWEVVGMTKYLSSLVDYRGRTPTKVDEGVFLLTARNIRDGKVDYAASEEFIAESEYEDVMRRGRPEVGDVLFTTEAPLGQVANMDRTDVALAQRVIKFRGQAGVLDNYFLKYWLMGSFAQADMERLATGSTALGIKGSKVVQLRLCLPPNGEQREIVTFLDTELAKFDTLTAEAQRAIDLLQERRTALISAAVTGQIDVRAVAEALNVPRPRRTVAP